MTVLFKYLGIFYLSTQLDLLLETILNNSFGYMGISIFGYAHLTIFILLCIRLPNREKLIFTVLVCLLMEIMTYESYAFTWVQYGLLLMVTQHSYYRFGSQFIDKWLFIIFNFLIVTTTKYFYFQFLKKINVKIVNYFLVELLPTLFLTVIIVSVLVYVESLLDDAIIQRKRVR